MLRKSGALLAASTLSHLAVWWRRGELNRP
jgi:hypothetical protein